MTYSKVCLLYYKPVYEGPRPTNTLKTSSQLPSDQQHLNTQTELPSRRIKAPWTISRGRVGTSSNEYQSSANLDGISRSAKRLKTHHELNISPKSGPLVEPVDQSDPSEIEIVKHNRQGQAGQTYTDPPSRTFSPHIDPSREYNGVEILMNSDPKKAIRDVAKQRMARIPSAPLLTPSKSKLTELRSRGAGPSQCPPKNSNQATMERLPEPSNSGMISSDRNTRQSDKSQLTLDDDQSVRLLPRGAASRSAALIVKKRQALGELCRMDESFCSLDGSRSRRRGHAPVEDNLGSDELAGPAENGRRADVIPVSPGQRSQLAPVDKSSRMESEPETLKTEPSNIKPTAFSNSDTNTRAGRVSRIGRNVSFDGEMPWHVPVAALNVPGSQELYTSPHMNLIHDTKSDTYMILESGKPKLLLDVQLRVEPRKLLKCIYESDGLRMRFEHSKSGHEDNLLDLQLSSEKDVHVLLSKFANLPNYVCRSLPR